MIPAAAYARASTEQQCYSASNQLAVLGAYAAANSYDLVRVYEDDGRSGLDFRGRPGLRALIRDVVEPDCPFRVLLVYDVSRWGRFQDPDEGAYYEFMCRRAGVGLVYCAEPFSNEQGAMASLVKNIKRLMAAEYSRELSSKVILGQQRLTLEGYCQGGAAAFGLRRQLIDRNGLPRMVLERGERKGTHSDRVVLVPGPKNETELIVRIFRMYVDQRFNQFRIAAILNAERHPSPRGGQWTRHTVDRILHNEKYAGTNVHFRTVGVLKQPRRVRPQAQWVRKEGAFEAVVSAELFRKAQILRRRRRPYRTDEEIIAQLKEVLRKCGGLTGPLIASEPNLPSRETISCRFKGLYNAFRLAGFEPPMSRSATGYDRGELLGHLRALLERHGRLSTRLIKEDSTVPSPRAFRWTFGSLREAYAAVGFVAETGGEPHHHRRADNV